VFPACSPPSLPDRCRAVAACVGGPSGNPHPPQPAKAVDLERYAGLWYEAARYDMRFEKGCDGVTAELFQAASTA
jgi:lipocalin